MMFSVILSGFLFTLGVIAACVSAVFILIIIAGIIGICSGG